MKPTTTVRSLCVNLLLMLTCSLAFAGAQPRSVATVAGLSSLRPAAIAELVVVRSTATIYLANSTSLGDWSPAAGVPGAVGPVGPTGPQGPPGPVPRRFANASALALASPRVAGEYASRADSNSVYVGTSTAQGAWQIAVGQTGPAGPAATIPNGVIIRDATGNPFINATTRIVYLPDGESPALTIDTRDTLVIGGPGGASIDYGGLAHFNNGVLADSYGNQTNNSSLTSIGLTGSVYSYEHQLPALITSEGILNGAIALNQGGFAVVGDIADALSTWKFWVTADGKVRASLPTTDPLFPDQLWRDPATGLVHISAAPR